MVINLVNSLTKQVGIQQTYLSSAIVAGGTTLPVKNIDGFSNQYAVQIGQTGGETSEIVVIGAPTGNNLPLGTNPLHLGGTALFPHNIDTPLYHIHYDQFVLYRSTTGTAGTFSALATASITPDSLYTQYDDTSGALTYAYYAQYRNSVSGDVSGSSGIFLPGGLSFYSLGKMRQRIKDKLYSSGYINYDSQIDDWINEWYELMTNAAIKVNQGYMLTTGSFSFGTSGVGTVTDANFKQAVKIEITWDNGVSYTPTTEIMPHQYSKTDSFSAMSPRHAWTGENTFEILPHGQGGTALMTYAQRFFSLVNDTDELTNTLRSYTTCCIEYCLSVAYGLDQKSDLQGEHYQKFVAYQNTFIAEVTPRDQSGVKMIDLTEGLSGMNEDVVMSSEYFL